jgi:hypothetical protein
MLAAKGKLANKHTQLTQIVKYPAILAWEKTEKYS